MSTLVSVPWQPGFKATPDTLALLNKACTIAGHLIILTDAWRSYAEQKYYWDAFVAGWGNLASNPDDPSGQNNHRRAAAFDIRDFADRAAMLEAGFTPDAVEWWHFNNPNWRNMPIINTDTTTAATSVTNIKTKEQESMAKYFIGGVADSPQTIMFGGPGMLPVFMPNGNPWLSTMRRYADYLNADATEGIVFTKSEWLLIRQALGTTEPTPIYQKQLTKFFTS